jgi:hypothetical protein
MSAGNVPQLVAAVVSHARKQHEDSEWDIVISGMTFQEVADVLAKYEAKTPKGAIRAMRAHLATLRPVALPV